MKRSCLFLFAAVGIASGLGVGPGAAQEPTFRRAGVIADRERREVRVEALAAGLEKGALAEFILIGPKSGHAYEAVAVSKAAPSDVHAALVHAGFQPGRPIDPAATRFWPRGERVEVTIEWAAAAGDADAPVRRIRAEETILDRRTGKSLPPEGFVFVGSMRGTDHEGKDAYLADIEDPMSIISVFNHTATVFDIPRQGTQDELYNHQFVNPEYLWPEKTPLTFVFRPARPDGPSFEMDARLRFVPGAEGAPVCELSLNGDPPEIVADAGTLAERIAVRAAGKRDVFALITFDDRLSLHALRAVAATVKRLAEDRTIRIEPPPEGELYFQAFAPNEVFRERARRPAQPWELKLRAADAGGAIAGTLISVLPREGAEPPEFDETTREVPNAAALAAALAEERAGLPVLLVYAPAGLTYAQLRDFVRPALKTHPIVYFFEE